jgi:hypothetical protein
MGLKPNVWELEEKPSDGSAGVVFALSEGSEDSLISGRWSAILGR